MAAIAIEDDVGRAYIDGRNNGRIDERARLRPLLERCEALARAQLHLHQRLGRPDAEVVTLFENLIDDLRRELGKEG